MITEDKIAAAQLAQIFGSELALIDERTEHRPNNSSRATKIDPKRILLGQASNTATNRDTLDSLQREAEAAFPFESTSQFQHSDPISVQPSFVPSQPPLQQVQQVQSQVAAPEQFDRLCSILERLVNVLESSDVIIKKQPQTRKLTNEISSQ